MTLQATLDHIGIAVPSFDRAETRWRYLLGGKYVKGGDGGVLAWRQLRYAGGGRLEMLASSPSADGPTIVTKFLDRFGAQIHHVTLTVPDLLAAVDEVSEAGLDVVDVNLEDDTRQEAFLRPSQVGGLIVQVASSPVDTPAKDSFSNPSDGHGVQLVGAALSHPDLDQAARVWTLLGATVTVKDLRLRIRWGDSPLELTISCGAAGPVGLRMSRTDPLPQDDEIGPAVLAAEPLPESD